MTKNYYVGLSTSGHDPAISVVDSRGRVMFAEALERMLQDKRAWGALPDHYDYMQHVLQTHCRDAQGIIVATTWLKPKPSDSELSAFQEYPSANVFPKPMDMDTINWQRHLQRSVHLQAGRNLQHLLGDRLVGEIRHYDHHLCHATYACADSPYREAKCLIMDGEGEKGSVSAFSMRQRKLTRLWRSYGPGSVGDYYAWLTDKCGFSWRKGEEWKVMGLAALGTVQPRLLEQLRRLMVFENGKPILSPASVWQEVTQAIDSYSRTGEQSVELAADLAASGQQVFAEFVDQSLQTLDLQADDNLVYSGGCALNSAYNGTLCRRHSAAIHVPSAPGDDGNAIGAALLAWQEDHPEEPLPDFPIGAYLGSLPDMNSIQAISSVTSLGRVRKIGPDSVLEIAELLKAGKIIGVMRGRAEFGPRALGNRSIIANPAIDGMKDLINLKVKGRESYRPFAPVVKLDHLHHWFDDAVFSPYMSFAIPWKKDSLGKVEAVVHYDGTGRLQTVTQQDNAWVYHLLSAMEHLSLPPILLNTSFNIMGKPIVHRVEDAVGMLFTTGLDAILLEDTLIEK